MLEKFYTHFRRTSEHWLFWPFIALILLIAGYNFILSDNGYFAYQNKLAEKNKIIEQINELKQNKADLKKNLGRIKDDKTLIEQYVHDHYLYNEKVMVLKFLDTQTEETVAESDQFDLIFYQRMYIILATVLLAVSTFFFWNVARRNIDE